MTGGTNELQPTRRTVREILAAPGCLVASSVYDPISARIAKHIGCEVGVLGGSIASHTILGAPDIVLMTATELVEQARRICRTDCVNLLVDADHGYGNALNVMRTISELQAAGVAGTCIEDTVLPRVYGQKETSLVSLDEGVKKMRAAVDARGANGNMLILARTNALAVTDAHDAAARLQAYEKTGVDALFLPYLKKREDLDVIAQSVSLPIIIAGSHESLYDLDYLASRGVKVWMWGHQTFAVVVQALHDAMSAIHAGALPSQLKNKAPDALMNMVLNAAQYDQQTKQYLE